MKFIIIISLLFTTIPGAKAQLSDAFDFFAGYGCCDILMSRNSP